MRYLVDASTIIALDQIGELDILRQLLGEIAITREVLSECATLDTRKRGFPGWMKVIGTGGRAATGSGLGAGESSLLAIYRHGDRLVLDDLPARNMAAARGIPTTGLLGLLLAGARSRILTKERALQALDALLSSGFHVAPALFAGTRRAIEEC